MASFLGLSAAMIASMLIAVVAAKEYTVGEGEGWRSPASEDDANLYEQWASIYKFQVGDSLLFVYHNDSVVRVDKRGYYHCNESSRGMAFKDGTTVVLLDKPGFYYFVSGDVDHCKRGQRMMIDVLPPGPSQHGAGGPSPSPTGAGPSPSLLPSAAAASFTFPAPRGAMLALAAFLILSWRP